VQGGGCACNAVGVRNAAGGAGGPRARRHDHSILVPTASNPPTTFPSPWRPVFEVDAAQAEAHEAELKTAGAVPQASAVVPYAAAAADDNAGDFMGVFSWIAATGGEGEGEAKVAEVELAR
jgi:hypothetical protein